MARVDEWKLITSLRVVVHLWPAVPTDANSTDGMARSKSASFITLKENYKHNKAVRNICEPDFQHNYV